MGRAQWSGRKGDFWNGSIDRAAVFDKTLTDEEVTALHDGEQP